MATQHIPQVVPFPTFQQTEKITQLEPGALLSIRSSERTIMQTPAKEKAEKAEKAIGKALDLSAEEEKEFLKTAKEVGLRLGELIRSLLRGYVEGEQIRQ